MSAATAPALDIARRAAAGARSTRAEWLVALEMGLCSVSDVVLAACEPSGRPLLRLPIIRLLTSGDRSRTDAIQVVTNAFALLQLPIPTAAQCRALTVQWLVDGRAGGKRLLALTDALDPKTEEPWGGFPYARGGTN